MKKSTFIIGLFFAALFMMSCEKDKDTNKSEMMNPEKFKAVITGVIATEIEFDESKIANAGDLLRDYSSDYLSFMDLLDNERLMVIRIHPPDDHPYKDDVISIQIQASKPKPWTRNNEYVTRYYTQSQIEDNASVTYIDASEQTYYRSYWSIESSDKKIKIWRVGKLLKGEIIGLGLESQDNKLIHLTLNFEIRPGDDGLTD